MKKVILFLAIGILSFGNIKAQDYDFETWANVPLSTTVQDPIGWASFNALMLVGTSQSVFKQTVAPYAGSASAKIVTVKIVGAAIPNPYTGINLDTTGLLAMGTTQLTAPYIIYGKAYAWRPATLSFASKYSPMAGDSAMVIALLTHWNGTSRDTVASGVYTTGATTTSYAINTLTMTYYAPFALTMPDSQQVFVSSSVFFHPGAKIGSTFYIDGLAWGGYVSTNDMNGQTNNVSIFPTPAKDNVTFKVSGAEGKKLEVFDVTGRSVGMYQMMNNEINIQTSGFKPGMYFYNVLNDKNEVINRNKFEIAK